MSHTYLLDTYKYLQQRLESAQQALIDSDTDQHTKLHTAGRIEALCKLETFLKEHYDIKLPRRLRRQHQQTTDTCR